MQNWGPCGSYLKFKNLAIIWTKSEQTGVGPCYEISQSSDSIICLKNINVKWQFYRPIFSSYPFYNCGSQQCQVPLLYSQVQRGYALGDSQEYSKGFARMTDKTKIQDSNDERKYYWLLLRPMFCSFIKCTSGSFWMDAGEFEEEEKNDVRVLDWRRVSASQELNVLAWNIRSCFQRGIHFFLYW